jgi:hypothetical protein
MSDVGTTPSYLGNTGPLVLFSLKDQAVVIDTTYNMVVESGDTTTLFLARSWDTNDTNVTPASIELAQASLSSLDISVITASSSRLYTVPKGAQEEAKKALEWHSENHRGGTPVGLNTAHILAKGGQIGLKKVRHIAKYFPRHEVDKKGKGWAPGEDNFPSNGRIAWALWGGDTAWRWARAIVERENKAAKTASGMLTGDYTSDYTRDIDLSAFKKAKYLDPLIAPEFLARVRLDGSGMDRLYKIDLDGSVYVWDDGSWDSLGTMDGDIWLYDSQLDSPYDNVEKSHIPIDPDSAIIIAAKMQQNPYGMVSVEDLDAHEAALATYAISEIDWSVVDNTLTAAGATQDGVYTPQERSSNAGSQVRNSNGTFAEMGGRVVVGGDASKSGVITDIDSSTGKATIKLDSGQSIQADVKKTETEDEFKEKQLPMAEDITKPLDTSGILATPRTPRNQPYAKMSGDLPPMTADDLHSVLYDYSGWIQDQRASTYSITSFSVENSEKVDDADNKKVDPYDHPLLVKWRLKKDKSSNPEDSNDWASPVIASTTPVKQQAKKSYKMTPETSDGQPLYFAIVAEDDVRAVLELVAVVPASSTSNTPMTYKRRDGKWVRDEAIMNDMKSATPPPVVPLNSKVLNDVLLQVDQATVTASGVFNIDHLLMVLWGPSDELIATSGIDFLNAINSGSSLEETFTQVNSIQAAGGFDRNKGNAEQLREYWTHGKGAAKIRWGTGGDWKRCVRHLSKYLGVRAKGYCQLRHKDALGYYTSTHAKMDRKKSHSAYSIEEFIMEEVWGENTGKPTLVTEKDMLTPIEDIMKEHDDLYEKDWTPEPEIENLLQDEACRKAMTAAGGLDRNRGNAENLRRYWTHGEGGTKVRWNTGGDWTRCVRHLSKYLGPRAKGYCALRHKEMTGMWTGDKPHRQLYGRKNQGKRNVFSTELIDSTSQILSKSAIFAKADLARESFGIVASANTASGASFYIPLLIPEDIESGDGRRFKKGSITNRELPLPLLWQIKTAEGHNGSVVVGRIDKLDRVESGLGNAYGVFDSGPYGREAERLVRNGFIRGISADMDKFEAEEEKPEASEDDIEKVGKSKLTINKARVMAATIVPKPAFQECKIILVGENNTNPIQEDNVVPDGVYVDDADAADAQALVACGFIAGAIPIVPPAEWFENPRLDKPTPLTVDDTGRVYGHIAAWHVDHIGMAFGTKPPRSRSNYAYFHTGVVRADNSKDYPVGQLTLAGGHASLEASAYEAAKHYDDTASAVADVHAGEDRHGIWVAGSLRSNAAPEQIRALRASAPSGDWRPIKGSLELVAVCQVNVPGFPIARARVASGAIMALVAAGASTLAKLKADPIAEMASRIEKLEASTAPVEDFSIKVADLKARIDEAKSEFAYIPEKVRQESAKKGHALPDGSFPIENVEDVKAAIHAYGRAKESHKAAVRKHITKRAKQLGVPKLVPENWKTASTDAVTASAADLKARVLAAQESLGKTFAAEDEVPVVDTTTETPAAPVVPANTPEAVLPGSDVPGNPAEGDFKFTPGKDQPRDVQGRFRDVLARLSDDLGESGLQDVVDRIKEVDKITGLGDYKDSADAAKGLLDLLNRLDEGSLNKISLENVRATAAELGKVISNLPLPFDNQAQKVRFSDLPPALKNLMTNMVDRVGKKIGKDDAAEATKDLQGFMSGSDLFSQADISSQMAKMLRLLT